MTVFAIPAVLGGVSCSQNAAHRVLTFFFEGVPEPGGAASPGAGEAEALALADAEGSPRTFERPTLVKPKLHWHPPYRNNRCNYCHDVYQGKLVKTPEEGLCVSCHTDPPGDREFIHGPVAANACLMCHHHHVSANPRMLVEEVEVICYECHDIDDLLDGGDHHAVLESESPPACIQCHDPHGGSNEFFLKQSEN